MIIATNGNQLKKFCEVGLVGVLQSTGPKPGNSERHAVSVTLQNVNLFTLELISFFVKT